MRFELLLIFIASLVQAQAIAEGELLLAQHGDEEAVEPVELALEDLPAELTVMVKAMQNPSEKKGGCTRKGCGNGCGCGPWKPPRHDDALEILRDAFPEYQVYIPRRRRHCRSSSYSSRRSSSCSSSSSSSYSSSSSCSVPTCWDNYLISCSSSSSSRDFCGPVPPKPCPKPPKPPCICSSSSSRSSSSSSSCHRPRPPKPCPKPKPCRSSSSSSSCQRPPKPCPKPPKPCPKPPKPCPKPPRPSSSSSCSFPRPRPCPRPPKPCSSSSSSSSSCHRPKPCPKPPKPTPCPKPPKPDCHHRPCPQPSESSSGLCDLCPKFKAIEISRRLLAKMQYYLNNGRYADIWPLIHPSSSYYIQKLKGCDNCIYEFGSLKNYFPTTIGTEVKSMLKGYHYFKDGSVALHTLDFVKQSGMCKETYEMYYYYSADHGCNYKLSYITGRNVKCKGCLKPQARCGK